MFNERLPGLTVTGAKVFNPIVLRIPVEGDFEELVVGKVRHFFILIGLDKTSGFFYNIL